MENQFDHHVQQPNPTQSTGRFTLQELEELYELSRRIRQDSLDDMQAFTVYGATQQAMASQQGTVLTPDQQQKLLRSIALNSRNSPPTSTPQSQEIFPAHQNLLSPSTSAQSNSTAPEIELPSQLQSRLDALEREITISSHRVAAESNEVPKLNGSNNTDGTINIGEMLQWGFVAIVLLSLIFFHRPILTFLFGENSKLVPSQTETEVIE